jgi:long-chain fatty acid transport protein
VLLAAEAWADDYHANDTLVGSRAAGMGGAVVGVPEDGAAPYYNPAAYTRDGKVQINLSANGVQVESLTYRPYLGSLATAKGVGFVPNFSVGSGPVGDRGRLSICAFTTQSHALVLDRSSTPDPSTGLLEARVRRIETESTALFGPSVGFPLSDTLSVGISGFFVYQTSTLRENAYQVAKDPDAPIAAREHLSDSDQTSQGISVVGGLQYQPTGPSGWWTFGVSLRSGASLANVAHQREELFVGTHSGDHLVFVDNVLGDPTSKTGKSGSPSAASLGASFHTSGLLVAASVTVLSGEQYESFGETITKQFLVNGGVGAEYMLTDRFTLRAGVFSNRSSAPVPGTGADFAAPHIDFYGFTIGGTQVDEHTHTDLALKLSRASGVAKVDAPGGGAVRADVSGFQLTLTIGGGYHF